MDHAAPTQVVDVCIRTCMSVVKHSAHTLVSIVQAVNKQNVEAFSTRFVVKKAMIQDAVIVSCEEDIEGLLHFTQQVGVPIGHVEFIPLLHKISRDRRASLIHALLGCQGSITSMKFSRQGMDDAVFQAIMSAIPFARSTHSLAFDAEPNDLPWIAYAIFHPKAESSAWRFLDLQNVLLTARLGRCLTAMASGNNLLALLNAPTDELLDCTAYYCARLAAGTTVQVHALSSSETLAILSAETTVDVCGVPSLDRSPWGKWSAVIVPAYGMGWVRRDAIETMWEQAPSKRSLTGLRVRPPYIFTDGSELLNILEPTGSMLTYLDITCYQNISASVLRQVLSVCPLLKVLISSHRGELWVESIEDTPASEPRLEELDLTAEPVRFPSRHRIAESLCNLRAIRFRVNDDPSAENQHNIAILLANCGMLRYFHWRNEEADRTWTQSTMIRYPQSHGWTPKALKRLGLTDHKYLSIREPVSMRCAHAFLSVVAASESTHSESVMGRLVDRDVLHAIFQFAATRIERQIFIEPNDKRQM